MTNTKVNIEEMRVKADEIRLRIYEHEVYEDMCVLIDMIDALKEESSEE